MIWNKRKNVDAGTAEAAPPENGLTRAKTVRRKSVVMTLICASLFVMLFVDCGKPTARRYFMINYIPPPFHARTMQNPYACVVRLREFSIEEAYNRFQIVYRLSPYEMRYYNFRSWAVRPARMVTDLFFKHLNSVQLVSSIVRRLDEGRRPDYEITGFIEALEEYDSEDVVFAHVALRVNMTKLADGTTIYSRRFDLRRRVYNREMEFVIREMSHIMEYIFTEVIADIDAKLAVEFGITEAATPSFMHIETPSFIVDADTEEGISNE